MAGKKGQKKRVWSNDEKLSICAQARVSGVSVAQVARRYAMNTNLIHKWLRDPRFASGEQALDLSVPEGATFLPIEITGITPAPTAPISPTPSTSSVTAQRVDIMLSDGGTTIAKTMAQVQSSGTHEVRFRDAQGKDRCAVLSVRHATMTVRPPIGKQRKYRHQELQIIHAEELDPPEDRAPILWKLITNLPVGSHTEAVHKLEWYALRWKIETFFRTLKTGCRIEELRLASAERLANCIALCCVVAWRVSWLAMLSRETPAADPAAVFTQDERNLLDHAATDRKRQAPRDLEFYVRAVARLGGYLDRASDAPPGTTVIWRGFSRLADLVEGARIATSPRKTYG